MGDRPKPGRCQVPGCPKPRVYAKLCNPHYRRLQRTGQVGDRPIAPSNRGIPVDERFWTKVDRSDRDGCWPWTGYLRGKPGATTAGYGRLHFRGRVIPVTHVAWYLANGELPPEGMLIMHRCDNPPCVRPSHLMVGTYSDNMRDAQAKGRRPSRSASVPPPRI